MRIEEDECSLLKQKIPILFTFYFIADNSLHRDTRVRPASVRVSIDKFQRQKEVFNNKCHSFTTKRVS